MTTRRKVLRSKIVGVSNYTDVVATLKAGDELAIEHEPDNAYDPNAMKVMDADNRTVGYLPKETAKRVIEKDSARLFLATVDTVNVHEEVVVGGFVTFETEAGYIEYDRPSHITQGEDMGKFRVDDEVIEQGREGWESSAARIRSFKLPAGRAITVIPITDYATQNADGGWMSVREVYADTIRVGNDTAEIPGRLRTFPVQDFITVVGRDGSKKRRYVADTLLERTLPTKWELKGAREGQEPPKHAKPKDVTYFNCIYIDGQLETGDRAKYNPKPGDHILVYFSSSWYESWKKLMERDRKKIKDYSPGGRRWTIQITGSFAAGNLGFEADDAEGEPIELPQVMNLDDYFEGKRAEIEAYVSELDNVEGAVFTNKTPSTVNDEDEIREADDDATEEFEDDLVLTEGFDWSTLPAARLKKLLLNLGVQVKTRPTTEELLALAAEHEAELLSLVATAA